MMNVGRYYTKSYFLSGDISDAIDYNAVISSKDELHKKAKEARTHLKNT